MSGDARGVPGDLVAQNDSKEVDSTITHFVFVAGAVLTLDTLDSGTISPNVNASED